MTVVGIDDTDSRTLGMCTTYVAVRVAGAIEAAGGEVRERLLVRCNPAVEHKTRGNAALALRTDLPPDETFAAAREVVADAAETADGTTHPGLVVAPGGPGDVHDPVVTFARRAVRDHHDLGDAVDLLETVGYRHEGWKRGRGRIGALAAVGADAAFDEWTYERIAYRERDRWGTDREVDRESLFSAARRGYPEAWDTVDRERGEAVCVPHTPGPVLYGIRGDGPDVVRAVAEAVDSEPVAAAATFRTNQGTDAHLRAATVDEVRDGRSYRVDGVVNEAPETRDGGHVFFAIEAPDGEDSNASPEERDDATAGDTSTPQLRCVAFEPTKRFRNRVRSLRVGDRITACGEVAEGTLKLEKFAVRELDRTELATPECPDCGTRMESAGSGQGYRCRSCGTGAEGKVERAIERDLEEGWYEVPPCARRHIAKPLVRGGFDAPVHPER